MNRQIPEYLEAEWQTAKDEYKVKTTTYITITKFEYEKLQQENQNLKEEVIALGKGLTKTRIRRDKYKRRYLKEKWKNKQLKKANEILKENAIHNDKVVDDTNWKIKRYKSVLDEIREFIKKCSFSIEGITNEYHDIVYAEDIKEILDKVKE